MKLTDFLPGLLLDLPGVPRPTAVATTREVVQEWCRHTQVWRHDLGPIDVVAHQAAYALTYDGGGGITATVESILEVEWNGGKIDPITETELRARNRQWRSAQSDTIVRYVPEAPSVLLLYPVPKTVVTSAVADLTTDPITQAVGINRVYCVLAPDDAATDVDDVLKKWKPGIQDGIRIRLKRYLKRELRDGAMFATFENNYRRTKSECRALSIGSQGGATTQVAARFPGSK